MPVRVRVPPPAWGICRGNRTDAGRQRAIPGVLPGVIPITPLSDTLVSGLVSGTFYDKYRWSGISGTFKASIQ